MENNSVLESENAFLKSQVAQLQNSFTQQETFIDQLQNKIQQLEEFIHQLRHKQFSSSSEKLSPDQIHLFDEAEATVESDKIADTAPTMHVN